MRSMEPYARSSFGADRVLPVNMPNAANPGISDPQRVLAVLPARCPGLVVPGRLGTPALRQCRAARALGSGRTRKVRPMRLLPAVLSRFFQRRRQVNGIV